MRRVLVTVVGPERRASVAVSASTPIGQLMGDLLARVGPPGGKGHRTWMLTRSDKPLPPDRSLEQCDVTDGAILHLNDVGEADEPRDELGAGRDANGHVREKPGAALPARAGLADRLSAMARAMVSPERIAAASLAPDGLIAPATLTLAHPRSKLGRGREAWRETDYRDRLDRVISGPRLQRCTTMAVMSPKGGVGKTTISALLGTLYAHLRRDHIIAVDTNPDYGSLGRSLTPEHASFVDDLLPLLDGSRLTVTALQLYLGRGPHGLMVLPTPTDRARMARLDERAYLRVIGCLQEVAGVVILDCGTGLQEPPARAALATAEQVVLVTDAEPATASIVAEAARSLTPSKRVLLVVNKVPAMGLRLDLEAFARLVPGAQGLVTIPSDVRAASQLAAGEFGWGTAPSGWRIAAGELAAMLVVGWRELGLTVTEPTARTTP
jgi:MinD-like ATPase involved in chromosome partitioning or flagellar assembly